MMPRVALLLTLLTAATGCGDPEAPAEPAEPTCEAAAPVLETLRLTAEGTRLFDEAGREVMLRGVNAGGRSKFAPFIPFPFAESGLPEQADAPPFDEAVEIYYDMLASWGLNVVRMPFSWEALEPTRGTYDATYMGRYLAMAAAAEARGIRVIVDFHQDVFASAYCGDGFPLWAVPEPWPELEEDCSTWFSAYFNDGPMHGAWDRFWADEDGLMVAFEAMWTHMATEAWVQDGVIGFEIINEPAPGNTDEEVWAPQILTPFYERMADVVRVPAPGALVFFDSTGLDAVDQETLVARPERDGMVFAPHFYEAAAFLGILSEGDYDPAEGLERWADQRDAWGLPMIVGEFGIKPEEPVAFAYMDAVYDGMDAYRVHATIWEVSTTVDDWNEEAMSLTGPGGEEYASVPAIVRPYPAAVAGRLLRFTWDKDTGQGELVYEASAGGV